MTRPQKLGLIIGIGSVTVAVIVPFVVMAWMSQPAPPKKPILIGLDQQGPYLILATRRAANDYSVAIAKAAALHPQALQESFDPSDLAATLTLLKKLQPRYVLAFVEPDELDVNFAWRWLTMATQVDEDPFVDIRTGFVTGASPEETRAFVERISDVVSGKLQLPGAFVDNLGPPEQGNQQYFNSFPNTMFVPVFEQRFTSRTISHGKGAFTDARSTALDGAGIIHFGGHGHPDRIDDGVLAQQVARLQIAPSVVFNGACYTGVTHRWFDVATFPLAEKQAAPTDSFCLRLLANNVVGYLAAVHPDHGIPVYQEMEYLAYTGAPLGDLLKHTHDGVVIGAGGKLPKLDPLENNSQAAATTPAAIMLKGTAARVLFGDPALIVGEAFTEKPFAVEVTQQEDELHISASVRNVKLKSEFTDTFFNDLNPKAPFNDRALIVCELPTDWSSVQDVKVDQVTAKGQATKYRLVGFAVEHDQGKRRLHIQVDVPATGFQQSAFRASGSTVTLVAKRGAMR